MGVSVVTNMSSVASSALEIAGRVGLLPETLDTPVKESAILSIASLWIPGGWYFSSCSLLVLLISLTWISA